MIDLIMHDQKQLSFQTKKQPSSVVVQKLSLGGYFLVGGETIKQ